MTDQERKNLIGKLLIDSVIIKGLGLRELNDDIDKLNEKFGKNIIRMNLGMEYEPIVLKFSIPKTYEGITKGIFSTNDYKLIEESIIVKGIGMPDIIDSEYVIEAYKYSMYAAYDRISEGLYNMEDTKKMFKFLCKRRNEVWTKSDVEKEIKDFIEKIQEAEGFEEV